MKTVEELLTIIANLRKFAKSENQKRLEVEILLREVMAGKR
jgi:hypothetical protein